MVTDEPDVTHIHIIKYAADLFMNDVIIQLINKIKSWLWLSCTDLQLLCMMRSEGWPTAHDGGDWGCDQSLDIPSLMPLSIANCGRLQLGIPHWARLLQ